MRSDVSLSKSLSSLSPVVGQPNRNIDDINSATDATVNLLFFISFLPGRLAHDRTIATH